MAACTPGREMQHPTASRKEVITVCLVRQGLPPPLLHLLVEEGLQPPPLHLRVEEDLKHPTAAWHLITLCVSMRYSTT